MNVADGKHRTDMPYQDAVEWSRNHFARMAEGAQWGIPRSGLLFTKLGNVLKLTARMPHDPAMPITAAQLDEQQRSELASIRRHFEAAGVAVEE